MFGTKASLSSILSRAQLPALPQSAVRLLELSQNPEHGPFQYAVPIEADPGLTSQVLRFVNSSYFGFRQEISSVKLAISLVGVRTIKNFTLWSAVFSVVPDPKCGEFCLKSLWQDSLRRGLFARALGKHLKLAQAEDLFATSVLQDMAIPVLAKELPTEYAELLAERRQGQARLSDLEHERFGWTHAQAGADLARKWRLPDEFAFIIEQHASTPDSWSSGPRVKRETKVVAVSALLPSTCDPVWHERDTFLNAFQRLVPNATGSAEAFLLEVDAEFSEFAPFLRLSNSGKRLVEYLQEDVASAC